MISKRSFLFVLLAALLWPLRAAAQETEEAVVFGRDVWPIFVNRCAKCHGPEKQKNDLRLDSPQGITQGGKSGAVIAPGEPLKSILYQRVSTGDWDPMIMPAEGDPLTSGQVGVIRRWIEAGATYEGWTPEMTETVRDALTVKLPPLAELPSRKLEFNRDIRPILSDNCFRCHGPDKNARKAKLRLDVREVALSDLGKRWAIVPGDIERSQLVRRIFHHDETERMPPAESGKSLTEDEKRTLAAWVASGAEYQPHWAYIPPVRPELTSGSDLESPIDALVLARLRGLGLDPSPRADPVTLIRRLSFDLTGLPPTLEQVRRYAESPTEDTYEAVVNELMASPHYGERMALDWLDQVRYADTNGYHSDNPRSIYPYRDYVIEAFNSNKPYDRFTVEQLAGDLLPDATRETRIASGFNRLNQVTAEGGAQEKEYLAEYMADRVRTIGSVWLGATIGCAQCHDHKFDPYTSKDFYAMGAFFADIEEPGVVSSAENYAPYMLLPDEAQARQLADFVTAIDRANEKMRTPTWSLVAGQRRWEERIRAEADEIPKAWMPSRPRSFVTRNGSKLEMLDDLSLLATGEVPNMDVYEITLGTNLENITGVRLEALSHPSFYRGVVRGRLSFWVTEFEVEAKSAGQSDSRPIKIIKAEASSETMAVANAIDGDLLTGWRGSSGLKHADPVRAVFTFAEPIPGGRDTLLTIRIKHLGGAMYYKTLFGRIRLSLTTAEEPRIDRELGIPEFILDAVLSSEERSRELREAIAAYYRTVAPDLAEVREELGETYREQFRLERSVPSTLVSVSVHPRTIRILARGNWQDETGEEVEPATPNFLPPLGVEGRRATRLDLARWIVSRQNSLTARVYVNRLWKLYFGRGLSKVLDDLGSQGESPTHPELLDWLALQFMDSGWDIKHVVKLIVMSETYRQSSLASAELREVDPYNQWLARQSPVRLQAEMIRDNALAISGLLSPKIGGPSVKPYQPEGYWDNLYFPARTYKPDEGEDQYRRGLYAHWQRTFLHPSLKTFDAPTREECTAERSISNTPLQALVLLNDPTYVEAARIFAEGIIHSAIGSFETRLDWAYLRALSRKPSSEEARILSSLFENHLIRFRGDVESAKALLDSGLAPLDEDLDVVELAAWTSIARTILNLHETITRS